MLNRWKKMIQTFVNHTFITFWFLPFLVAFYLPVLGATTAPAETLKPDEWSVHPITRKIDFTERTGNNNYFNMALIPGTQQVTIASSGSEDILFYSDSTFKIKRMEPTVYHRDVVSQPGEDIMLLAGSNLPPDTGGTIIQYDRSNDKFSLLAETEVSLNAIEFIDESTAVTAGGHLYPNKKGVIYKFHNNSISKMSPPRQVVYHDADWKSPLKKLLIVGEGGVLLAWTQSSGFSELQIPKRTLLKTVSWHPTQNTALLGGTNGALYRYKNSELTKISTNFDWTIQDIGWHSTGKFAVLVGAHGGEDRGYWAFYEDFGIKDYTLSNPLFSIQWFNKNNALLGGQKELWRISRKKKANDFGLKASLSTTKKYPDVSESIGLSGFGSTYNASADSIAEYRFHFQDDESTEWQSSSDYSLVYNNPGNYNPVLEVRGPLGKSTDRDSVTIQVDKQTQGTFFTRGSFFFLITVFIFLGSLVVAFYALKK